MKRRKSYLIPVRKIERAIREEMAQVALSGDNPWGCFPEFQQRVAKAVLAKPDKRYVDGILVKYTAPLTIKMYRTLIPRGGDSAASVYLTIKELEQNPELAQEVYSMLMLQAKKVRAVEEQDFRRGAEILGFQRQVRTTLADSLRRGP